MNTENTNRLQPCPECEKLKAEVARLKMVPMKYRRMAFNAQLQDENTVLKAERNQLAEQVEKMREALLAQENAENYQNQYKDIGADAVAECIDSFEQAFNKREEALTPPDLSTSILNNVRAHVLSRVQHVLWVLPKSMSEEDVIYRAREAIRALAADIEAGKC